MSWKGSDMSDVYDYRISDDEVNDVTRQLDRLENRQLLKLKRSIDDIEQADENKRLSTAKGFFDTTILPVLIGFAEVTSSLLLVNECDDHRSIIVTIQNKDGFEITGACHVMKGLLVMASSICVSLEKDDPTLSLLFDLDTFIV